MLTQSVPSLFNNLFDVASLLHFVHFFVDELVSSHVKQSELIEEHNLHFKLLLSDESLNSLPFYFHKQLYYYYYKLLKKFSL